MAAELLEKLRQLNISVQLANGKLDVKAPKGALTPGLVQEIKLGMDGLVRALSEAEKKLVVVHTEIPRAPEADSYPLSSAQERLWLASQFEAVNIAYNIPSTHQLQGSLDTNAFSRALDTMVERHEALRTVYRLNDDGEVRQYILPAAQSGIKLKIVDASQHPGWEQWVAEAIYADFTTPFNLATGPIFRGCMYKGSDDNWVFTFVLHHIISDAVTVAVLLNEMFTLFLNYSAGKPSPLKPLPIQYHDYAVWQRQQLNGGYLNEHRNYWLRQFAGELPVFNFPGSNPRPAVKTYGGEIVSVSFDNAAIAAARELCQKEGATLFMYILAVVQVLLFRCTGQKDIILGTPVAGRNYAELQGLMGIFINNLLLRCRTLGDEDFITLLRGAREQMLDAYTHQVYPFDSLLDDLNHQRDVSRSPLFDVMLILQNAGMKHSRADEPKQMGHLKAGNFRQQKPVHMSKYDLTITFFEIEKELHLDLEYNTAIYTRDAITRLTAHLQQLFKVIPGNTGMPVSRLDFLHPEEKQLLINDYNNTAAPYPAQASVGELFTAQALQTPDNVAVKFENTSITYRQLEADTNRLARCFRELYGIGENDTVGVMLNRSEKLILALLAVLKAGAAYVPLDPDYPPARRELMMQDTGIKLLVTETEHLPASENWRGPLINLDEENNLSAFDGGTLASAADARSLAYIMYTSGSTGAPKGVMVEHRGVVRLVKEAGFVQVTASDTLLSLSGYSFDGSVFDIFGALLNGATLLISKKEVFLDTVQLSRIIENGGVTGCFITTSLFNLLAGTPAVPFTKLRFLLFGGERASVPHIRRFMERHPSVQLFNVYGPTENTTFSTCFAITDIQEQTASVPIGKPIGNSTVFVLDGFSQPVPVGIAGEICVGGHGLARGYLKRPELTAEKFIPHPFQPGEKLYRTGDLGRWLPDGNIEFIGRMDDQVKIRGYRIEPGEVEAVLLGHKGIETAAVIVHETPAGEKELAAFISGPQPVSPQEVAEFLNSRLPAYMIPAHFVQMEQMPLNANGKADKKLLQASVQGHYAAAAEYTAPRNPVEETLVQIWREVLERDRVGVKDNFFELGGHSLKATKLALSIRKAFNIELSLTAFFTAPTVEAVAAIISRETWLQDNQAGVSGESDVDTVEI